MSMLGTLVVRIVANMVGFKGDLDKAAKDTADAAAKIEGSTSKAGAATGGLADKLEAARKVAGAANGDLLGAAQGAQALSAGAGVAVVSVGLLVAGIAAASYAAYVGAQEAKAYEKSLILTGNAAGTNASQMQAMAAGIDKVVGTQAQAAAGLAQMAGTGLVAGNNLQKFTQVAIEMERGVGVAVGDTVKQFAALGADPVKASLRLNETTNYLTASTFAQIKAAEELGDKELAASLAQNAYADAMEVRTAKIAANVGTLEKIWKGLGDVAAWAWDKMLGIGRENGPEQVLEKAKAGLANLEKLDVERRAGAALGSLGGELQVKIAAAKQQVTLAQETVKLSQRASQLQADGVVTEKAKVAWIESGNKFLTERQKKDAEILLVRNQGLAALASEEDIQKRIAVIEARGAGARAGKPKVDKSDAIELAKQEAILSKLAGVNADYQQQLTRLQAIRAKGTITEEDYIEKVKELIGLQPAAKKYIEDIAKANLAGAEAHRKYVDSLEDGAGKLEKEVQQLREHNERIGLGKIAVAELDAAKLEATANTLESFAIREFDKNLNEAEYELSKRQIAALREKAALTREGAGKEVGVEQAKKASEAWNKTAGDIQKDLTDSLMRGFEKGKTFAENLRDTVVNMFKTMVLRPTVSAIVNAGASAIGLGVNAGAGAGSGGGLAGLSGISNIASGIGSIGTVASQVLAGGMSIANAFGTVAANISGTGLTGLLATNGAFGTAAAGAAGGAGLMSGIGAAINAVPVWGQIAFGIAAVASLLGGKGDTRYGSQYAYTAGGDTRIVGGPNKGVDYGNQSTAQDVVIGSINSLLKRVGSSQQLANFSSGFESSEKGKGFSYAGGMYSNGVQFGQGIDGLGYQNNRGSKTTDQALAEYKDELLQVTLQALQAAGDIPKNISDTLKDVDIDALTGDALKNFAAAIDKQITDVESFRGAVQGMPFKQLHDLSFEAAAGMIAAGGGLEALSGKLGTYYENFYSEEEKRAQTIASITATLNAAGGNFTAADFSAGGILDTREEFKALVETIDPNSFLFTALLSINSAFAGITPAAETMVGDVGLISVAMKQLQEQRADLNVELMRAQGNTAGADKAQRVIDTTGLSAAETAFFDGSASIRAKIDSLNAAKAKQEAETERLAGVAAQRGQLEISIMGLQGNAAGALAAQRQLEIDALDETLRPLKLVEYGLLDLAATSEKARALAAQRGQIEISIMSLQGNAAGALAAQRQLEIDALDETLRPLKLLEYGLLDLAATSEKARAISAQRSQLEIQSMTLRGDTVGASTLQMRNALDALDPSLRGLQASVWGLEAATKNTTAAQDALVKTQNSAFDMLKRSVDFELRAANTAAQVAAENVNSIKSIFGLLKSNVNDLYSAVDSTRAQAANEANAFIANALATAQTTGYLPEQEALADAIAASRKGLENTVFASQVDQQIAQLELAGKLSQLKDISGTQLTQAERMALAANQQVDYLNGILDSANAQLGALNGINTSVLSLSDALAAFASAKGAVTAGAASPSAQSVSDGSIRARFDYALSTQNDLNGNRDAGKVAASERDFYDWAYPLRDQGVTMDRVNKLAGWEAGTAEQWAIKNGLPLFEKGTDYVPQDGLAFLHEGERVTPKAFNPALTGGSSGNSDAAIERLTAKVEGLTKELAKVTANTGKTADNTASIDRNIDKVTDGGNAMRWLELA